MRTQMVLKIDRTRCAELVDCCMLKKIEQYAHALKLREEVFIHYYLEEILDVYNVVVR